MKKFGHPGNRSIARSREHEFVFDGKPRKIQLCRVCGRSKANGNHTKKTGVAALGSVVPGGTQSFELQAQTRVFNVTCAVTGSFASEEARAKFLEHMAAFGFRVVSAIVLCILLASPAAAQNRFAWPQDRQPIAETLSNITVYSSIGLDTIHSMRSADRSRAFACQAFRLGFTVGAAEILKRVVQKRRPDGSDFKSFPSMHTGVAMASAGWKFQIGIPIAAATGAFRMGANRHDVVDVAAGAGLGWLTHQLFCERP